MAIPVSTPADYTSGVPRFLQFAPPSKVIMSSAARSTYIGVFVGGYLSAVFYGLTSLQTFLYFKSDRMHRDSTFLRIVVAFLWILDTTDSLMIALAMYDVDVSNQATALSGSIYWAFLTAVFLEAIMAFIVRVFYCHRILKLSHRNFVVTGLGAFLAVVALVFSLWLPAAGATLTPTGIRGFKIITYLYIISGVIVDTLIAATMTFLLWRMNQDYPHRKTSSVIHTLILYSVSTGALTSVAAIGVLIAYVASDGLAYSGVILMIGKLYFNAFLASLNKRPELRTQLHVSAEGQGTSDAIEFSRRLRFTQSAADDATARNTTEPVSASKANITKSKANFHSEAAQDPHVVDILPAHSGKEIYA